MRFPEGIWITVEGCTGSYVCTVLSTNVSNLETLRTCVFFDFVNIYDVFQLVVIWYYYFKKYVFSQ